MKILVVDDEDVTLSSMKRLLRWQGIKDVETCDSGKEAIRRIKAGDYDIVLLDLLMPEVDGIQVLESSKPFKPQTEFIIITAVDVIAQAVKTIRLGAYDYLVKPVDNEHLMRVLERAYERRGLMAAMNLARQARDAKQPEGFAAIVTESPQIRALLSYAQIMAKGGNPILITGESGTGKELLARGIHREGPSPAGPFVAVNISSIPETLFESQFFGHIKGAFTGALRDYEGFFEQADGGTLFLDEIGEFPQQMQSKLLRASFRRPTRIWTRPARRENSGSISCTASVRPMSTCPRSGSARTTSRCSPPISSSWPSRSTPSRSTGSALRRWISSCDAITRETSGSWPRSSKMPCCWPTQPPSCRGTWARRSPHRRFTPAISAA